MPAQLQATIALDPIYNGNYSHPEKYILFEVIPFINKKNSNPYLIAAGCSLGAFHAANTNQAYYLEYA